MADDPLYGFDIADEASRAFLSLIIASGKVAKADMDELFQLSLMRGAEEWTMLMDCARAIREKALGLGDMASLEPGLVPFLGLILTGQADDFVRSVERLADSGELLKRARGKQATGAKKGEEGAASRTRELDRSVSHFWTDEGCQETLQSTVNAAEEAARLFGNDHTDVGKIVSQPTGSGDSTVDEDASGGVAHQKDKVGQSQVADERYQSAAERVIFMPGIKRGAKSPFFCTPTAASVEDDKRAFSAIQQPLSAQKPQPGRSTVPSLPIPPLSAERFGLIQEEVADDHFRLLVVVTFLIKTKGRAAIPIFRKFMDRFPTPQAIASADPAEIIALIHSLGLSAVRCSKIQRYARLWLEHAPCRSRRYGVKNYPSTGDGLYVRVSEEFGPEPESIHGGQCSVSTGVDTDEADAVTVSREMAGDG
ncbi:hypothetical protein B0H66DRAFT_52216 [Apodospora peruviana]|uniref:HhH-GPD domain-containing protein n=1 Tax=Apodospora peruviana TaxID=516989 RepID=A0AAE0MFX2_9PEZI|nr:hypothetical protein B0H66DRAFT_52216 [Apodospora peruviana]